MVSHFSSKRGDVKNSLTKKCKNCITGEPSTLTRASNVKHVDSTACSGFSRRCSLRNLGIGPALKSNARNSASSLAQSGRAATATHWNSHHANSRSVALISSNVRSYVPSSVPGNSSRACGMRPGMQSPRYSSWQFTHRNLRWGYD